jgi:hypothetical protein
MTTTMTMTMMMFFASCFLLVAPMSSFSTTPSLSTPSASRLQYPGRSSLHMGGYYSEPKDDADDSDGESSSSSSSLTTTAIDKSKTHMLFGVRCVADVIYCGNSTSVINLRPVDDTARETDTEPRAQQRLVEYLFTPDENQDVYAKPILKGKRIVQIGVGATALVCAHYGDCHSVVVVDDDETKLKIYEHAHQMFNNNNNNTSPCPLETMFLEPKDALPKADVIILSTQDEEWIATALDSDRTRTCLFEGAY